MGKGRAGGSRSQGDPDSAAQSGLSLGQLPGSKRSLNVLGLSSPRPGVGTRAERPPPPSPSGWSGQAGKVRAFLPLPPPDPPQCGGGLPQWSDPQRESCLGPRGLGEVEQDFDRKG